MKPPRNWARGDRVFFWSSAPRLELVALGTFDGLTGRTNMYGETRYRVTYTTTALPGRVGIAELRADPICANASFLKRSVAQGALEVPTHQAQQMYRLLRRANDGTLPIWRDIGNPDAAPPRDVDAEFAEGSQKMRAHLVRERSRALIKAKRAAVFASTGALACEVCGFDFASRYGAIGSDFCEVHHTKPLAATSFVRRTKLADLAIVCSNCHRMIHRRAKFLTIRQLQNRLSDPAAR